MPELPEVETVRRQLEPEAVGRTIESAEVLDERWTRPELPVRVEEALAGRRIESVGRRGKYLVVELDDGSALVMHLRMTGNLLVRAPGLDRGRRPDGHRSARRPAPVRVRPRDPPPAGADRARRRLGALVHRRRGASATASSSRGGEIDAYFASRLGIEPLGGELTPELLLELAADRRAPLKSFLLNQDAGRRDRQHLRRRGALSRPSASALAGRLDEARARGGASRRDRRRARGRAGATAARRSTTTATPAASAARCRTSSWSTPARASRACAAASRSAGWWSQGARPTSAPAARRGCGRGRAGGGRSAGERRAGPARGLSDRALDRRRRRHRLHRRDRAGRVPRPGSTFAAAGPGTRETDVIGPLAGTAEVTAVMLTGGSAFGLAAADGAMRWCEERGRGYTTPGGLVPIVPAAVIYDLATGDPGARPGAGGRLRGLRGGGRGGARARPGRRRHRCGGRQDRRARERDRDRGRLRGGANGPRPHGGGARGRERLRRRDRRGRRGAWPGSAPRAARRPRPPPRSPRWRRLPTGAGSRSATRRWSA